MKNKRNLLLVILLLVVVSVASASTYAWLTDTNRSGEDNKIEYTVGHVDYTITATQSSTDLLVPGDSFGKLTIANSSTVATNIRVKFSVTCDNGTMTYGTADTNHIKLVGTSTKWFLSNDGYYYYGANSTESDIAASVSPESLFDNLLLNGAVVGNDFAGAKITVTISFQAKQAENVEWADMGSINFETGLA